jgi:hypothetical protein
MAFTNPGKIVRLRSRPNGRGSVYEANMWAQQHSDGLFSGRGVVRNTVADMNVLVGGTTDNPDVVLGKLPSGFLIALDIVGQQVIRITAPSSNKRIASVVAYSDNIALNSTDTNTTGSPSSCGLIVVYGSTSATPVAPTESQIRQAVTQDGATGSQAVIAVIANITTESFTTTITDEMIAINYGKISSHSIDLTTMPVAGFIATKTNNTVNDKKPLAVQCGRARVVVPADAIEATVVVQFPEQFNSGTTPVVTCTYSGYGNASDPWTDAPNPSWAGAAIGAVSVTNSGFTARCRRFDGAMLRGTYYFSWIAIG